ncbi:hypothetical protein [Streptomyces bambusae]|uniref:Uncharacterized protein n=1 Tax=Streptomyces bambusae TaxID=1550616 RepID=A0ABS6ZJR3_9ACTN|nr:hypothetical protein [Streptomyces bambusae]MBW5486921.1 hypothetical protein [Streptomyces bambusae]
MTGPSPGFSVGEARRGRTRTWAVWRSARTGGEARAVRAPFRSAERRTPAARYG